MDCGKICELLSPYLDGELEPSERAFVSSHLKTCSACRRELEEMQAAVQIFRQLPELAPGPAFRPRLRERLIKESRSLPASGSLGPVAPPEGGRELRPALCFPGAAAQSASPAGSRAAPRRAGLRSVFRAILSGAGIWPKLAVAATLLLAIGITSLWYALAGPGLMPKVTVEQLAGSPPPKNQDVPGWSAKAYRDPEKDSTDGSRFDLRAAQPGDAQSLALPEPAPERTPEEAPGSGKEPARKFAIKTGQPEEVQKGGSAPAPKTGPDEKENAVRKKITLTSSPSEKTQEPAANITGAASGEKDKTTSEVAYGKEKPAAAGGAVAAEAAVNQTALPKKVFRRVKIELTGADVQKLSLLLARFARDGEQAAATGPPAEDSVISDETVHQEPGKPNRNFLSGQVEISKMPDFLSQIRLLGTILKQEETGRDITADYAKLEAELKQKQLQEEELQKTILAQNKNSRSTREVDSSLEDELTKTQTEIQFIKEKLQKMKEELKTVAVEIYWQK